MTIASRRLGTRRTNPYDNYLDIHRVTEKHLPPKVLVVHRFTHTTVPDAANIHRTRNVKVVMHMDGWSPP